MTAGRILITFGKSPGLGSNRRRKQVIPANVDLYITELRERVSSVTVWNCIYKLRRAAELINPNPRKRLRALAL